MSGCAVHIVQLYRMSCTQAVPVARCSINNMGVRSSRALGHVEAPSHGRPTQAWLCRISHAYPRQPHTGALAPDLDGPCGSNTALPTLHVQSASTGHLTTASMASTSPLPLPSAPPVLVPRLHLWWRRRVGRPATSAFRSVTCAAGRSRIQLCRCAICSAFDATASFWSGSCRLRRAAPSGA